MRRRTIDQHIGEKIRARRAELGLTQEQLAATLDISYQQIQKYETGANRISAARLYALARRMQVPIAWFFDTFEPPAGPGGLAQGPEAGLEHGGRQRATIEVVRSFTEIENPEVRLSIAGLVKAVAERQA